MIGIPKSRAAFPASLMGAVFVFVLLFYTSLGHADKPTKETVEIGLLEGSKRLIEEAVAFRDADKFDQAIEAYSKVINLDPEYVEALLGRGGVYVDLGDFQRAIEDYDKAIAINPNNALAYAGRGFADLRLGDFQQAIKDCGRAISINPEDAAYYYNRGTAYSNLGDYKSATEDYKVAAMRGNADAQVILAISGAE